MATNGSRIIPVILSGGSGSRLWPLSRRLYPKQLLPLAGEHSMIQETAVRVGDTGQFAPPMVICNEDHRFIIAEQLRDMDVDARCIVLEPVGRNTAPAAAVAAMLAVRDDPEAMLLLLPADHVVLEQDSFIKAVDTALVAASAGALTTFGIMPERAETGYGYIKRGKELDGSQGAYKVERFVEKPDQETAESYLADGGYSWNSGMFLLPAQKLLDELSAFEPEVIKACRAAVDKGTEDLDFFRLDKEAFSKSPDISIDYGVMERTKDAAVVPASMGWTDVGAWSALWDIGEQDEDLNVLIGDTIAQDTRGSYVRSCDGMLTAVVGLEDVVVVTTDDVVMVAAKDRAQDVKKVVESLKAEGRPEADLHKRVYRPWGFYQGVHDGDRFQVKRITVNPGAKLSLQKHFHRAEHWIIVNGTAIVTRDEEEILLRENESVYIPLGAVHRLENPGRVPLNMIEVQSGSYLGEDDIVRLEDTYGRAG